MSNTFTVSMNGKQILYMPRKVFGRPITSDMCLRAMVECCDVNHKAFADSAPCDNTFVSHEDYTSDYCDVYKLIDEDDNECLDLILKRSFRSTFTE
jgi:hypothetical protein